MAEIKSPCFWLQASRPNALQWSLLGSRPCFTTMVWRHSLGAGVTLCGRIHFTSLLRFLTFGFQLYFSEQAETELLWCRQTFGVASGGGEPSKLMILSPLHIHFLI